MSGAGRGGRVDLPGELSSFVGRRRELAEVRRSLAGSRLVTLTGVGGVGKSRLALRVASGARRAFPGGVWFVDLTHVRQENLLTGDGEDTAVLADLVLDVLGLRQERAGPPLQQLINHLAGRRVLLVLDSCEHLLPASAALVVRLLSECPELRVLATSRESIGVGGEVLYPLAPLAIPDSGRLLRMSDLDRYESLALFVIRARAVRPGLLLTDDDLDTVAQLCRRLDGLPLAIELAAARMVALSPRQILDRLSARFSLLSRGTRSAPARHQTLQLCVEWSFDLCSKPEQLLWARLSIFAGGFELDAVEGICADDDLPIGDILDLLAGLVEKSIIGRVDPPGTGVPGRYRMLETIREYGAERLTDTGTRGQLRRRHRDWYQRLAERASAEWISRDQPYWFARLHREHPNLRAAMEYSLTEPGEAEAALQMVLALPRGIWLSHAVVSEGRDWLKRALSLVRPPPALRSRALVWAGALALFHGEADTMTRLLNEGQLEAGATKDSYAFALAGYVRAHAALYRNAPSTAIDAAEQGLASLSAMSSPDPGLRLHLLHALGQAAGLAGEHLLARQCYDDVLRLTESFGESAMRSYAMWGLGLLAWHEGYVGKAGELLREGLRIKQRTEMPDPHHAALSMELLAWTAVGGQQHLRAAGLLGAADALFSMRGQPLAAQGMLLDSHVACERQARAALGDARFEKAFQWGRNLPFDEALAYALDDQEATPPPRSTVDTSPLTRREHEVALLIAEGLSNEEIAGKLVISRRTAESHVEHILAKLGFTGRTQVAIWMTQRQRE